MQRLEKEPFPQYVIRIVKEQIEHYKTMPSYSSEANILRSYTDVVMDLPWHQTTPEIQDLDIAQKELDKHHFGLEKIKERVIEYLAVNQQTKEVSGQVICLVGPPGVGKTSLAKSIAKSVGRKFVRISVGGIDDGAEIKGHRRTYLGAMPGKIIQGIKQVGVKNPVFLIDEIDKMVQNFRGDPGSIMLEIFDKEQNKRFVDNYLGQEMPFDLSKVMFVCTANSTKLPRPLLDRVEIINLSSYTEIEKTNIAEKHLIPEILKEYKLDPKQVTFRKQAIKGIIQHYT